MRSLFINYRRSDSEGEAGRLFDELTGQFSDQAVFMDVAAIEPGWDFRKAIDQSIASCTVLLAMIGQEWLDSKDPSGRRRLDDSNDFVRIELASALRRDIPVIPVLVRGARMPRPDQLPEDLKDLAYRNAVELTHARWRSDIQVLLRAVRPYMGQGPGDEPSASDQTKKQDAEANPEVSGIQNNASRPEQPQLASSIPPQTIEQVGRQLAAYIGPISEIVVKRAAKRCTSAEDLYETVAREIEAESDRTKFLKWCRSQGF